LLIILVENSRIYEVIPIELFVDTKNLLKIVEIAHKTMSKKFIPLNVYLKINLEGEIVDLKHI
jgi:hypothetical protein